MKMMLYNESIINSLLGFVNIDKLKDAFEWVAIKFQTQGECGSF